MIYTMDEEYDAYTNEIEIETDETYGEESDQDQQEQEDWEIDYHQIDWSDYEYMPEPSLELLQAWTQAYWDAIDLAGGFLTRVSYGVMAFLDDDEFVFTCPQFGPLNKNDYIHLMNYWNQQGLDIASAIPDLKVHCDGWHIDPQNPWRIWVTVRYSGTHTNAAMDAMTMSGLTLSPVTNTEVRFMTGPELHSFWWKADGSKWSIRWHSMGYVGDSYTGSNQGYGGFWGLLISMGYPRLLLEALEPWERLGNWISQFRVTNTSDRSTTTGSRSNTSQQKPRRRSPYSRLPQWWHDRESPSSALNIHKWGWVQGVSRGKKYLEKGGKGNVGRPIMSMIFKLCVSGG